jgi:hypothetical protein
MICLVYLVIVITTAVLIAIGGLLLIRRSISLSTLENHNDVAGFIYAVIGVIYAVLLAFVVDTVWDMHRDGEALVENEAKTIMDIYLDASALSGDLQQSVRTEIINYVKIVIEKEWDMMSEKKFSAEANHSFFHLNKLFRNYQPKNQHEYIWYEKALENLIKFGDYRNLRLLAGSLGVAPFMWVVLIFGGILTIGFSFMFGTKNLWAQIVMVSVLTSVIALTLTLIWAFELPFSGPIRVEPDAFKLLLEEIAAR